MFRKNIILLSLVITTACLSACATARQTAPAELPLGRQESLALAVLVYSKHNPTYLYDNGYRDLYIQVQGRDPTPQFLRALAADTGWHVFPGSAYSRKEMQVGVGCSTAEGDSAHCGVGAGCGPLCRGYDGFDLKRFDGRWTVVSRQIGPVS